MHDVDSEGEDHLMADRRIGRLENNMAASRNDDVTKE
jgi:hypothetical protein